MAERHHPRSFEVSLKIKAVAFAEENSKEAAVKNFNVCTKRIREWCSQKDQLHKLAIDSGANRKRLVGAGRKPLDQEMEEELLQWIIQQRDRSIRVSRKMIIQKAKDMTSHSDLRASRGWLDRFLKRKHLSLRHKTTVC